MWPVDGEHHDCHLDKDEETGRELATLTSDDAGFTLLAEAASVDNLLVGDLLGMVMQGEDSTVTIADIVYHTTYVARMSERALILAEMPFVSYGSLEHGFN